MKKFDFRFVILMLTICLGCGTKPRPVDMPELFPATLVLVQDGVPLADALVSLHAMPGTQAKWRAGGFTDRNGKARLRTGGDYDGSPIGRYKVVVHKQVTEEIGDPRARSSDDPPPPCFSTVEPTYSKAETTPLEVEIKREPNRVTLDAGKAVRIKI